MPEGCGGTVDLSTWVGELVKAMAKKVLIQDQPGKQVQESLANSSKSQRSEATLEDGAGTRARVRAATVACLSFVSLRVLRRCLCLPLSKSR